MVNFKSILHYKSNRIAQKISYKFWRVRWVIWGRALSWSYIKLMMGYCCLLLIVNHHLIMASLCCSVKFGYSTFNFPPSFGIQRNFCTNKKTLPCESVFLPKSFNHLCKLSAGRESLKKWKQIGTKKFTIFLIKTLCSTFSKRSWHIDDKIYRNIVGHKPHYGYKAIREHEIIIKRKHRR